MHGRFFSRLAYSNPNKAKAKRNHRPNLRATRKKTVRDRGLYVNREYFVNNRIDINNSDANQGVYVKSPLPIYPYIKCL